MREQHPTCVGRFRLVFDLRTGRVRQVVVEKSTGYRAMDASMLVALKQWRLKPNRWREFNLEVKIAFEPS
jgi:TonB family protein